MAIYKNAILTDAGRCLLQEVTAGEGELEFLYMKTGNGTYRESDARKLKDIVAPKQKFYFASITKEKQDSVVLKAVVTNEDLEQQYSLTELGVFARKRGSGEDVLYCLIMAEKADIIPDKSENYQIIFRILVKLHDAEKAVITFNSNAYATAEDLHAETNRAATAEVQLNTKLEEEIIRATEKESTLKEQIDAEYERASQKETVLETNKLDKKGDASNTVVHFAEKEELEVLPNGGELSILIGALAKGIRELIAHIKNTDNPHKATKVQIELGEVDNTADMDKPVSTAQQVALDSYYQQSTGYTDQKIADLINGAPSTLDTLGEIADAMAENADVVTALETSIGSKASEVEFDSHVKDKTAHVTAAERNKWNDPAPTFTQAGTRANIASGEKLPVLMGKIKKFFADLKAVAFSGSYNDLSDKPTIPTVGNGTVTIKQAGTSKGTFTMNQSGDTTIELTDTNTTYAAATTSKNGLMSAADKAKLDGIAAGAQVNSITGVKGNAESAYRKGNVNITPANIGLGNVNNTADANKSVNYANSAGNADTVDGMHGWQLGTLDTDGSYQSDGNLPMYCKYHHFSDGRFGLCVDGYETRVNYATMSDTVDGRHASDFLLTHEGGRVEGQLFIADTITGGTVPATTDAYSHAQIVLEANATTAKRAGIGFHNGGKVGAFLYLENDGKMRKRIGGYDVALIDESGGTLNGHLNVSTDNTWILGGETTNWLNIYTRNVECSTGTLSIKSKEDNLYLCSRVNIKCVPVDGSNGYIHIIASAFNVASSIRVKKNVEEMSADEARKILDVTVVAFDYIEQYGGHKNQRGVIAEDVYKIIPSVVSMPTGYDENGEGTEDVPCVDYSKFVPYLIKMIQIQQEEIDALRRRVDALEKNQ